MTTAWVYAIAALAAAATIYGAIRFFGQRVPGAPEDHDEGHLEVLSCTPVSDRSSIRTSYSFPSTAFWQKIAVSRPGACTATLAA